MELASETRMNSREVNGEMSLLGLQREESWMYCSTSSECAPQYMKTSWTPLEARNSRVYSITGTLTRGSRHWGSLGQPLVRAGDRERELETGCDVPWASRG